MTNNPIRWNDPLGLDTIPSGGDFPVIPGVEIPGKAPGGGSDRPIPPTIIPKPITPSPTSTPELPNSVNRTGPWLNRGKSPYYEKLDDIAHFGGIAGIMMTTIGSVDLGVGKWVAERRDNLLYGRSQLHPRFMDLADDAPDYANRFLSGRNTLRLADAASKLGRFSVYLSITASTVKLATGKGTLWDVADIAVTSLATWGAPALVAAGLISNPVGWAIVAGGVVYTGFRIYQEW